MPATLKQLTEQVLGLSEKERAELAHRLLLSLDDGPEEGVEEAWDAEIAERIQSMEDGTAKGKPADEVFREIRARYQ